MLTEENLNETLADAVMDRPREFFIGKRRVCLWYPTLGMSMMVERHLSSLDIDYKNLTKNPSLEAFRLIKEKRYIVCYILAILSFRNFNKLSNSEILKRKAEYYSSNISDEYLVSIFLVVLSDPKAETLISLTGIAKDQQTQSKIAQYKNKDGHTQSFGGKTIYGTLINVACKTFGWTKKYVVWGIDLISLRMMLADQVNSVYLSDKEMKDLKISSTSNQTYGMTPEDIAKLKAMDWD